MLEILSKRTFKGGKEMMKISAEAEKVMMERFGKDSIIALATKVDNKPYVRQVCLL